MRNYFWVLGMLFLQSCAQQQQGYGKLEHLGYFPKKLNEVSGIATYSEDRVWVIEDNGNKDHLYKLSLEGKPIRELEVKNAKNTDWEDLATDEMGNMYIGDFGNNANERKNLVIYKLPNPEKVKGKDIKAKKIAFYYPEQDKFPPKKKGLLYDTEGFFHFNGYLYVFTKNRTRPYNGKTLLYRIPDTPGKHKAALLGSFSLCQMQDHCSVTAADISPSGKVIALLGYGYLFLIRDFDTVDQAHQGKVEIIDLAYESQIESVCFLDETTLLIADEQSRSKGRSLYRYSIK